MGAPDTPAAQKLSKLVKLDYSLKTQLKIRGILLPQDKTLLI